MSDTPALTFLHALETARKELIAALDSGSRVSRCIECFVDALYQIHGARDELRRRATLIETCCGPGSAYEQARAQSLESDIDESRMSKRFKRTIGKLRIPRGTPCTLEDVDQEYEWLDWLLNNWDGESQANTNVIAKAHFERWRSACRTVQKKANMLQVYGCWLLLYIHEASEDDPSDQAEVAKSIVQEMGSEGLRDSIKAAADSIMDWAKDAPSGSKTPKRSRRGREKAVKRHGSTINVKYWGIGLYETKWHLFSFTVRTTVFVFFWFVVSVYVFCGDKSGRVRFV